MLKIVPLLCFLPVLISCNGESEQHQNADSGKDTAIQIEVPQFDLGNEVEAVFIKGNTNSGFENGMKVISIENVKQDDSLYIMCKSAQHCEDCFAEYQIWRNDKYVDLIRDTGYGGERVFIPASLLLTASKFGTPEYQRLSIYVSVRQYKPVETGNKKFLFYIDLK